MIKAIETKYDGYLFRSRLEARWAVFWNSLGIEYHYEPDGFDLGKVKYLPDFWFPQVSMWAEVKPCPLNKREILKATLLAKKSGFPVLLLIGVPDSKYYDAIEKEYRGVGTYIQTYALSMYHNYPIDEGRFFSSPGCDFDLEDERWEDTIKAVDAARSERFGVW